MPEIAFVGRSNVGKSSLINAVLARRSIAHRSKWPGKTRMCNIYRVGSAYYLVDLPGYGFARVSKKERIGFRKLIREYLTSRRTLAGAVWLLDIRREPSPDDLEVAEYIISASVPVIVTMTKADKIARGDRNRRIQSIVESLGVPQDQCLITSVTKKEGIQDLRDSIHEFLAEGART